MWKDKLKDFVYRKEDGKHVVDMKYLHSIMRIFPNLIPHNHTKKGASSLNTPERDSDLISPKHMKKRYSDKRREINNEIEDNLGKNEEIARQKFLEFMKTLVDQAIEEEQLSSLILPTTIEERNLWLKGEKGDTEEEVWKLLFLIYSSVKFGNYLVNLDNISDEGRMWLWETLVTSKAILGEGKMDLTPIEKKLGVHLSYSEPFFNSLALLGFWVKKMSEEKQREENEEWREYIQKYAPKLGFTEETSLIIYGRDENKKGIYHIFPRASTIISRWLDPSIKLIEFLNSFGDGADKNTKDIISKKREKLLFYLLKYNQINGELLSQLTTMKCTYELKKDKIHGIYGAKQFFSSL